MRSASSSGNAPCDAIRERRAFHEFHDERVRAAGVLEAVDRRDVGMVEGGEHLRFSAEPCDAITIKREGLRQDLQRDIAIELGVARAIDLAHAPFAEQGHDFVRADASAWGERHGNGWDYRGCGDFRGLVMKNGVVFTEPR
jgi:hypothetical protein